jgi:glutamyl-tRNA synthetase
VPPPCPCAPQASATFLTDCTYEATAALAEPALRLLQKGETIQVERRGFYICDKPYVRAAEPMRLFFVPDGKNMHGYRKPQK